MAVGYRSSLRAATDRSGSGSQVLVPSDLRWVIPACNLKRLPTAALINSFLSSTLPGNQLRGQHECRRKTICMLYWQYSNPSRKTSTWRKRSWFVPVTQATFKKNVYLLWVDGNITQFSWPIRIFRCRSHASQSGYWELCGANMILVGLASLNSVKMKHAQHRWTVGWYSSDEPQISLGESLKILLAAPIWYLDVSHPSWSMI